MKGIPQEENKVGEKSPIEKDEKSTPAPKRPATLRFVRHSQVLTRYALRFSLLLGSGLCRYIRTMMPTGMDIRARRKG